MLSTSQRLRMAPRQLGVVSLALALAVALAAAAPVAYAAKAPAKAAPAAVRTGLESIEKQVQEFTLPNGLKFMVVERHQAPVFSFRTVVGAGGVNTRLGTTGIAHMMEHMAFKGTAVVGTKDYAKEKPLLDAEETAWAALLTERGKGAATDSTNLRALDKAFKDAQEAAREPVVSNEFSKIVEQAGARDANAYTSDDITFYLYSMPSNRLELWAVMEGGRMTHPVFREFYKERDVVIEERRMGIESSPLGRLFDKYIHTAFTVHPYGYGVIGSAEDLHTFSRTQGDEYFRTNYVAKNMAVALVGDAAVADVQKYAQQYFGELPDAPKPPPVDLVEPQQTEERRVVVTDPAQPYIMIGWRIPAASDPAFPAYEALASLLGGGSYARLNKRLVKEKKILAQVEVGAGFPGEKYPNLFVVFAVPAAGQDPLKVEQEIYAALDEIQTSSPLTDEELAGYKVRVRARKIAAAEGNEGLAGELAQAQIMRGDWREFFREQERVQALKVADLMSALKRSFVKENRTVGLIVKPSAEAGEAGGR